IGFQAVADKFKRKNAQTHTYESRYYRNNNTFLNDKGNNAVGFGTNGFSDTNFLGPFLYNINHDVADANDAGQQSTHTYKSYNKSQDKQKLKAVFGVFCIVTHPDGIFVVGGHPVACFYLLFNFFAKCYGLFRCEVLIIGKLYGIYGIR